MYKVFGFRTLIKFHVSRRVSNRYKMLKICFEKFKGKHLSWSFSLDYTCIKKVTQCFTLNFAKCCRKPRDDCYRESDFSDNHYVKVSVFRVFWSAFSRIRTEYGDLLCKSPYSVQMWENRDQKHSKYKHFLRSEYFVNQFCVF